MYIDLQFPTREIIFNQYFLGRIKHCNDIGSGTIILLQYYKLNYQNNNDDEL